MATSQDAVSELDAAQLKQAKAALFDLATNVRAEWPDASIVHLSASDQGEWMVTDRVTVGTDGLEVGFDDPDANDSCLYTDVYVLREQLFPRYDVRGEIEYTPRMGLISFRMDVAKVLAELVPPDPEHPSIEFKGVKVSLYDSTTIPGAVSIQIETEEGQKVRVMLNDGDLFIGDPNTDEHPWAKRVQAHYDDKENR